MSRSTVILLLVLCAAIAGLIVFSKLRSPSVQPVAGAQSSETATVSGRQPASSQPAPANTGARLVGNEKQVPVIGPSAQMNNTSRMTIAAANPTVTAVKPLLVTPAVDPADNGVAEVKPLPVMEKEYATATNRDVRLDLLMDIAETSSAEAVKTLTRLFEAETDADLKVDLLDSLLGIDGFKDEKLIMLTMGTRQGLPGEVRQSAIDGLLDLDDQRVIPILNGLLNDPDEEIREGAKDALEMLQIPPALPAVKLKPQ